MQAHPCFGMGRRTIWILEVGGDVGYEAVRAGSWCVEHFVGIHFVVCRAGESDKGTIFDDYGP
jgi:hypothetical protein